MSRRFLIIPLMAVVLLFAMQDRCAAQFRTNAFSQSYSQVDSTAAPDTSSKIVNFKEIFGGLGHKRSMRIGTMFGTSLFIPGASQIYLKEYWKLPIYYSGMIAGISGGVAMHFQHQKTGNPNHRLASTLSFVGAGMFYYASLMDGALSYKTDRKPLAGRATVMSILCPGLGQAYNGEYWKIPIYVGGIATAAHFYAENLLNYNRFRDMYREVSQPGYHGDCPLNATQAKYYRDTYRRYRDYSMLAIAAVYLLQIIDANVFSYMQDFEVTDDVSVRIAPSVTMPESTNYAFNPQPAVGASIGIRF